jgi:hypothetical protein
MAATTQSSILADAVTDDRVFRKVFRRLIWFLFILLLVSFMDRINIAFAALTMNKDLGLSAAAYGMSFTVFYAAYSLFDVAQRELDLGSANRARLYSGCELCRRRFAHGPSGDPHRRGDAVLGSQLRPQERAGLASPHRYAACRSRLAPGRLRRLASPALFGTDLYLDGLLLRPPRVLDDSRFRLHPVARCAPCRNRVHQLHRNRRRLGHRPLCRRLSQGSHREFHLRVALRGGHACHEHYLHHHRHSADAGLDGDA